VQTESQQEVRDRRVVRSRAALMAAAVRLVSERGTTEVSVTDLAEAANVGRQLVYVQFGDRDSLLVEAAAELAGRELASRTENLHADVRLEVLRVARHFAEHRSFYRAMLTGSCAFAMARALSSLFVPVNREVAQEWFGDLDPTLTEDVATFITAGVTGVVNRWLIDRADPLDPEELAGRLLALLPTVTGGRRLRADGRFDR
jgi:AcrR family transcriptional regulator